MRFFSPPENPSFRYRLEKSRGMSTSSIAASASLRKSLQLDLGLAARPRGGR